MSKETTSLEWLRYYERIVRESEQTFRPNGLEVIATELKKGERLESMYGNLEKTLVKVNNEKEKYKKAMKIIKDEILSDLIFNDEIQQIALEWGLIRITARIKDREKYELLKEILK